MTHTHLFGTALMICTLLAIPMISSAGESSLTSQSLPIDTDSQPITAVRSDASIKEDAHSLASKRARAQERPQGVDCFFEENKAEKDCRGEQASTR